MSFRSLLLGGVLVTASAVQPASAEFCSTDTVPAATLLLPYFAVDLDDPAGQTTLFSVNNALDTAGLAKVTLWSDWGVPTLAFNVYLTGYDVQTFNLRDVFNGVLPRTASDGQDPTDTISPQGFLSQDINIASCATTLPLPSVLPTVLVQYLRDVHTGRTSSTVAPGKCYSHRYPDGHARGYVTVDAVRACDVDFPSAPGYFDEIATRENRFWGTVTYIDPANNSAQQESLVHIEACYDAGGDVVPGAEVCPGGDDRYTFYGRLVGFDGSDGREPLSSVFATSYLNGGAFSGGTELIVWRDTKVPVDQSYTNTDCAAPGLPSWAPLVQTEVVVFDEEENPESFCQAPVILPPSPFSGYCFPFATQRSPVGTGDGTFPGDTITPTSPFGWLHLDLNHGLPSSPQGQRAQAWVMSVSSAAGRYSTAVDAIRLDSACDATLRPTLE